MNISPTENEIKYIRKALYQFNNERVGEDSHTPLSIVEYDTNCHWFYICNIVITLQRFAFSRVCIRCFVRIGNKCNCCGYHFGCDEF